jgi:predicted Rossmann fold nucleotide-binding protein DprA/Smf involved in DNA uptake
VTAPGRTLDPERAARVVLSRVGEPGDPRLTGLVAELGAATVLAGLREQGASGQLREDLAARLEHTDPAAELDRAERQGIRFVTPADDEWPTGLDDLAHGPSLHERGGVPIGLWVKGPVALAALAERSVAVVGSRSATTYGASVAGEIGAALGESGRTAGRCRSTDPPWPCSRAASTGCIPRRTDDCSTTSPTSGWSCPRQRPVVRRPGSGSWPATG